ncbi:hypothetical protein ACXYN8_12085 [Altererythrobacter sp. CAU 1778]
MSAEQPATPTSGQPGTAAWESEGGSVIPATPLPDGIIAETATQYRVGPYVYSRLDDAMAEYRRQHGP